ncbi:hypothetical protein SORBI_3004G040400 [Sorghum bicolor]|uniref:KIB1-4 beta-propeller domain-containing protein n=1 Tax=Sorghum bicolor TaxID=4558 RepID=A0A194YML2_SORBI|nr:hypothetical protein SORBI_3004G040400 [Sorghum bicolor]
MAAISPPPPPPLRPWCDLLPELLGQVLVRLPFPADRARFRAVCRGWHSVAALHVRQLPWLVLRDGSFCTVGAGGAFFHRTAMPGLPDGVTVVGSADGGWLLLDRTDCAYRRGDVFALRYKTPRRDVRHAHSYLLLNPFSGAGATPLPLPELDAVVGTVSEVFEIYRVAMRSSSTPDDLIAVVTSSGDCNVILCRPGKGTYVMCYRRVFDAAFVGDQWLYGITRDEELLAFRLAEDDDGKPVVTKEKRVIKATSPLPEAHYWDWMDDDDDEDDDEDDDNNNYSADDGGGGEDDAPNQEEEYNSNYNVDALVLDGTERSFDTQVPYRGDIITTTRMLVKSRDGELLMVRRQVFSPIRSEPYIMSVKVIKADVNMGEWISVGLAKDEAFFLSRGFCKSTIVFGDIQAGSIYFDDINDVVDTRLWTRRAFRLPWARRLFTWMTWIFPPKMVV